MPKRLVIKLILSLTILVAVAEGISGYINAKRQERQLVDAMIQGADQLSKGITSATWHAMLADHRTTAYEVMQTIALKQGINTIRIFNKEGRVMFSTARDQTQQVDKRAEACYLCHASEQPLVKVDVPSRARIYRGQDGVRRLGMVTPIYNEPSCSEADCHAHPAEMSVLGVLDVVLSLDRIDSEVRDAQYSVVVMAGIHIILIGILIALFTRHFVDRPIRKLIDGTRAVSAMQLDKPIEISSSEELAELASSFNVMRERLRHTMNELNQLTQQLESKVEERTEQLKAANLKLLQSDRMASLGKLSASVAHEINNPISGILNLSMLLQRILQDDGVPSGRVEEFRRYLSQVVNETTRVGRIVSDLLTFSRQAKPRVTRASLNGIIKTTLTLVAHKLEQGRIDVQLDLQEDLPPILCDNSQIQQVVMNLVMNGAEAMQNKGRGRLFVSTRVVENGMDVLLVVKDEGEGISSENLPRIFDPFFTTKEAGKSIGLGLTVVYGIVTAHGGDIQVDSETGLGTTFRVTLPLLFRRQEGLEQVAAHARE
jgi:two-component system, NtrC family, sensor kinase